MCCMCGFLPTKHKILKLSDGGNHRSSPKSNRLFLRLTPICPVRDFLNLAPKVFKLLLVDVNIGSNSYSTTHIKQHINGGMSFILRIKMKISDKFHLYNLFIHVVELRIRAPSRGLRVSVGLQLF